MRILYIDIDSCRPDHLGCYGYSRGTSPNIDAIAREGAVFRDCYTPDAPCLPSRTAMYSGRFGIQTGVVGHGGTAAQPKVEGKLRDFRDAFDGQGLARQLQKLGLHTAMISPFGQRHAAHWFYAGFNEVHNTGGCGMESGEVVQPVVEKWLDANASRDAWFLHVNYWDPHTPYRAPASFGEPFADVPLAPHHDDALVARHMDKVGPHSPKDLGMFVDGHPEKWPREVTQIVDRASLKKWIDGYDTGIRYVDTFVGQIVAKLKAAGVYDETAIIVSADHGENQGDLGIYGEHGTADAGTCRIPMIVKWPGIAGGGRAIEGLRYNVDLAPTLMDLLGGKHQPLWDGASFADALRGKPGTSRDDIIVSQCCHVCQRSVRWNEAGKRWLYMRTYHDGFHLFPQEMLFDLAADPYEQHDVASEHPHVLREGAWRLARWHDEQMQKVARVFPHDPVDPMWTVMSEGGPFHALHERGRSPLPKYLERLEATGRAEGAQRLRAKYAAHL